ncbi:MAG: hypothetical protein P8X63_14380 [Desulfuromonadaceae bacterium]
MKSTLWAIFGGFLLALSGCSASPQNMHRLQVATSPADAMVSLSATGEFSDQTRTIAGPSPLEKDFNFGASNRLWLEIERRGYQPEVVEVQPETKRVQLQLTPTRDEMTGQPIEDYSLSGISGIAMVPPDFVIINRKFSSEEVDEAASQQARDILLEEIRRYFSAQCEMTVLPPSSQNGKQLKSLWRDTRTAMEFLDPIRLPYLPQPPCLETRSGRQAACALGERENAQTLLLITGKQNRESASLIAGKIGMTVIGTASSYAGSYSRAAARGDSFFVYNVYTPSFAQGTLLSAALIDSATGEVLWLNKGLWGAIPFDDPATVDAVLEDLFSGLREALSKGGK